MAARPFRPGEESSTLSCTEGWVLILFELMSDVYQSRVSEKGQPNDGKALAGC